MEKALHVMLFMWCISFSVLGGQYVIGDVFGVTITNLDGVPVKAHILTLVDEDVINTTTENIVTANFTTNSTYYDQVETFTTAAAFVAWELVLLLSGTYIFNFLFLMGVPLIFVSFFVILYLALLARAIIGYVRGI